MKTTLALALFLIASPVLADSNPPTGSTAPAPGKSQMPDLLKQLNSTKMIQFDSIVSGVNGKANVPAIEVSGVYVSPSSIDITITKGGKLACRVVTSGTKSVAYSYANNDYYDFTKHNTSTASLLTAPATFIQTEVGQYSAGAFSLAIASVAKFSEVLKVADLMTPAQWVHSEDVENGQTIEKEIATSGGGGSTQTYTITYTNSPLALNTVTFASVSSVGDPASSVNVTFSKYNIISDPTQISAAGPFTFDIPAGAKAWIAPPDSDTPY